MKEEGMCVFEELRRATTLAQMENDLPDFLAERILRIADCPDLFRHLEADIADLIGQLAIYDTYGQTGYLGMGVNDLALGASLRRLEEEADSGARENVTGTSQASD